jgi:hypothetical protein
MAFFTSNRFHVLQGHPGDKGQKGDSSAPNFDIYAAVKVKNNNNIVTISYI